MVRPVKSTSSTSTTVLPVEVERDVGDRLGQHRAQADVVAVEGDVEACRPASSDAARSARQVVGQRGRRSGHATGLQPDEHHVVEPVVALDDLVRHAPRWPGGRRRRPSPVSGQRKRPRTGASSGVRVRPTRRSSCPCGPHRTRFTVRAATLPPWRRRRRPARGPAGQMRCSAGCADVGGHRGEHAVDEPARVVGARTLGQLDRLGDDRHRSARRDASAARSTPCAAGRGRGSACARGPSPGRSWR